jgi:hypothetical protein
MGAVLRGRDVDLGRDLAVKVLLEKHAERPEVVQRFLEEAQVGALFATDNPAAPVAFVHLTFKAETDPRWPYTVGYAGWEAFRAAWEAPDAPHDRPRD